MKISLDSIKKSSFYPSVALQTKCSFELEKILKTSLNSDSKIKFFSLIALLRIASCRSLNLRKHEIISDLSSMRTSLQKLKNNLSNTGSINEETLDLLHHASSYGANENYLDTCLETLKDMIKNCDFAENMTTYSHDYPIVDTPKNLKHIYLEELARILDNLETPPTKTRDGKFDQCVALLLKSSDIVKNKETLNYRIPKDSFRLISSAIDKYKLNPSIFY